MKLYVGEWVRLTVQLLRIVCDKFCGRRSHLRYRERLPRKDGYTAHEHGNSSAAHHCVAPVTRNAGCRETPRVLQ
jgi:hypothetical protein